MKINFTRANSPTSFTFELSTDNDEIFLGRTSLELNSDKISRKTSKLKHDMTIDGYKVYLIGMLEPTDPAILVKYKNKLTFTDTLTNGMKIDVKSLTGVKFMNVDGVDVEFKVEVEDETDSKNDPESENRENIDPEEEHSVAQNGGMRQ
jgi:hypothetical protein